MSLHIGQTCIGQQAAVNSLSLGSPNASHHQTPIKQPIPVQIESFKLAC